jgi:hypothetical protein
LKLVPLSDNQVQYMSTREVMMAKGAAVRFLVDLIALETQNLKDYFAK